MANTSRVVSRTAGAVACIAALVLLSILFAPSTKMRFVATDPALDGAVVDGITTVSRKGKVLTTPDARIVVVPHHAVASEAIAEGIARIAQTRHKVGTVIVLAPDHFGKCPTLLCTSTGRFSTFFGDVVIDDMRVGKLTRNKLVTHSSLFAGEHGVFTIVPFIKHYLPKAAVIPLVVSVKNTEWSEDRIDVADLLERLLEDEATALVISTDFSHYLPVAESERKDAETRRVLCSHKLEDIRKLDNPSQSDCPLCLWVGMTLATGEQTPHPFVFSHTNSARLLKDETVAETTSHFGIVFAEKPDFASCPVKSGQQL